MSAEVQRVFLFLSRRPILRSPGIWRNGARARYQQRLVRLHGWVITVTGGEGSTFIVELPLEIGETGDVTTTAAAPSGEQRPCMMTAGETEPSPKEALQKPLKDLLWLVAEDNP